MASIGTWMNKVNQRFANFPSGKKVKSKNTNYLFKPTHETYQTIIKKGLKTVKFEHFQTSDKKQILEKAKIFIEKNKPCLFIWDPISSKGVKDYFFDLKDTLKIEKWVNENVKSLKNYNFLLTSQIFNHGTGFVGSVYSNGEGKLIGETLHIPNVCSHRALSQGSETCKNTLTEFAFEDFDLRKISGNYLKREILRQIANNYLHLKGYFEFVYGNHLNNIEVITTGFESLSNFPFPEKFHELMSLRGME